MTLIPRLHMLEISVRLSRSDPSISTLDTAMHQHVNKYGTRLPLKNLHIGYLKKPYKILIDAMTRCPVEFKSLDFGWFNFPGPVCEEFTQEYLSLLEWTLPISCQDTLENLSMSAVVFPHRNATAQFFSRLQEFTRLKSIEMSLRHLREMIIIPLSQGTSNVDCLTGVPTSEMSLPTLTDSNSGAPVEPTFDYCYPTLRMLKLKCICELPGGRCDPGLELFKGRLAIRACPSLVEIDFRGTIREGDSTLKCESHHLKVLYL